MANMLTTDGQGHLVLRNDRMSRLFLNGAVRKPHLPGLGAQNG